jgi:hypothetical protein
MGEEQSVPAFRMLPKDWRQVAIALVGRMALRQIRAPDPRSDDDRGDG